MKKITMKKNIILSLLFFATLTVFGQPYPSTSYSISTDGKTLLKWNGTETDVDMQSDNVLKNVKHIAKGAFTVCKIVEADKRDINFFPVCESEEQASIVSITFPDGLETIGEFAFASCMQLTGNLVLPESLKSIGAFAFFGCNFKGDLNIPKGITKIEEGSFEQTGFDGCLNIPEGVTLIEDRAFSACAFFNCGRLVIPHSVKTIGENAFSGWGSMSGYYSETAPLTLVLGSGLVSVKNGAFYGSNYEYIYSYPVNPNFITDLTFYNYGLIKLYVPFGSEENYNNSQPWGFAKDKVEGMPAASVKSSKELAKTISFYPSPVVNTLNIDSKYGVIEYNVCDVMGKEILRGKPTFNELNFQIDMSGMSKGIYLIDLMTKNGKAIIKVVKK